MFELFMNSSWNGDQMPLWITYGWLGTCLGTILVILMIIWAAFIHYSYRRKWRTLDILLAAVLLQELPTAIILFVISSVKSTLIILPEWNTQTNMTVVDVLLWFSASSRFFQFAIITSLIADRALILKWPYQYRFAVRHSQIRFYMIALALVASLFGAFAVISHQNQFDATVQSNLKSSPSSSPSSTTAWPWTTFKLSELASNNTRTNGSMPLSSSNQTMTSVGYNVFEFSYDPTIYDINYSYFFLTIYGLLTFICVCSFVYVETNRPRTSKTSTAKQQRYLQSIATLFTTATTSSTATSSSTSSSLSASSVSPSRFSSLANLTNGSAPMNNNTNHQSSKLPSYYYPNVKHHDQQKQQQQPSNSSNCHRKTSDTLNSHYQISMVDGQDNGPLAASSSTYTSMTTTDNSIHRLIDATMNASSTNNTTTSTTDSRSNSLNLNNKFVCDQQPSQQRALTPCPIDPNNPSSHVMDHATTILSRVNSFTKSHHHHHHHHHQSNLYHSSSQLKLNTNDSNDSSSFSNHHLVGSSSAPLSTERNHHHDLHHHHHNHHHHHHHSPFDLRWPSVVGPVSFCFAFNHGPYLVFTLLAIFVPGFWTPLHDLILVGLSLFQALLLPLIVFISNETFRQAMTRSCGRCLCFFCCCFHRHSVRHKISVSSKNHHTKHKSSLAFVSTGDDNHGNLGILGPPPSYLHAAGGGILSSKPIKQSSNNSSLTAYHSDLNLFQGKCHKIDQSSCSSSSKFNNKGLFVKHNKEFSNMNRPLHATSMLDLSLCSTSSSFGRNAPYGNHHQHQHHYIQQPHHHASRSRYSLALAQQFPANNNNSLTPKSSFCRRPPSVASCHYLFSNQSTNNNNNNNQSKGGHRYSQYLFGSSAMPSQKSESTLSVPLSLAAAIASNNNNNHFISSSSSVIQNQLKDTKKNVDNIGKTGGKWSPISINSMNQFETPLPVVNNVPISNDEMIDCNSFVTSTALATANKDANKFAYTKATPKLMELISGLATRSSFRKRSVRKCDSDASTFYNRHNLKRSQIAQNQLSNILYNNFYNKKLIPSAFGSEIILLPENSEPSAVKKSTRSPLFRRMVSDSSNQCSSYDPYESTTHKKPQTPTQFPRPHVYLPSVASCLAEATADNNTTRSNSCQQLSILNSETDHHYHNHLLLKQNHLTMLADESPSSPVTSHHNLLVEKKTTNNNQNDLNNKNNSIIVGDVGSVVADDEPIYASLPEEVEEESFDEIKVASGSFSARSTLPDNCQLISYAEQTTTNNENQSSIFNVNNNGGIGGDNKKIILENCQNLNYNDNNNSNNNGNGSNSSSSAVGESTEDIYEEVGGHLAQIQNHHQNEINFNANENNFKRRSASEDTLIQQPNDDDDDPFDCQQQQQQRDLLQDAFSEQDDQEDMTDDEEFEELDEDQISILSETSSSTFSSFTTCANQDFEYIVSQQMANKNNINNHNNGDGQLNTDEFNLKSNTENKIIENKNSLEPSTLSMAAMYYNRLILNDNANNAKSGHRQRSKLNRRQSFSTAHELRQRILCNQVNNKENHQMGLIQEEDGEEGASPINGSIHEYPIFTANFNDMFGFKLDRRISTSEDNLLSIISTIANCGDDQEPESPNKTSVQNSPIKDNNYNCDSSTSKHGTFVLAKKGKDSTKNNTNNNKPASAIPRATFLSSKSSSQPSNNQATKITIKELKSKKQANKKQQNNHPNSTSSTPTKATKLSFTSNNNRIYELGSLWERQLSKTNNNKETVTGQKYVPISSLSKSHQTTTMQTPPNENKSPAIKPNVPFQSTTTILTQSPTNPTTGSRVPTFISVSPIRTTKQQPTSITVGKSDQQSVNNFTSKLQPPSEYNVMNNKQPKQDARQNAILAKNALLMSSMKSATNEITKFNHSKLKPN